jgi:hypothetical protein
VGDPIRTGTTPMSDILVAAITRSIGLTLGDRSGGGLLANPVLASQFLGATRLGAALGTKMVDVGWGLNKFTATSQGSDFTVETLSSAAATVTPARRGMARQVSDMARALQSMDELAFVQFVTDQTIAWQQSVVSLIASLFPSFSASGGVSGGTATWASILSAYQTLGIANSAGPYVLVLRPKDWANVASDAFALGGRVQMQAETDGYLNTVNPGFKGQYLNGNLWVYTSSELPTSAGDTVCGMFGPEALAWDAFMPEPSPATQVLLWTPLYGVEINRDSLKSEDQVVGSTHLGASIRQNAGGIKLLFAT